MTNKLLSDTRIKKPVHFRVYFFFILCLFSLQQASGQGVVDTTAIKMYNAKALKLLNQYKYNECLQVLDSALKIKENVSSYYYMAHIYLLKCEWEKTVQYDQKALALDPTNTDVCKELFYAYSSLGQWKEARDMYERGKQPNIESVDREVENMHRSAIVVTLLLLILAAVFFMPLYAKKKEDTGSIDDDKQLRFSEIIMISTAVSCALYTVFYALSHWIWSKNVYYPLTDYAMTMRMATLEHDGIESFFLYGMSFVNIGLTLLFAKMVIKLKVHKGLYMPFFIALLLISGYYFYTVGFFPPFYSISSQVLLLPAVLTVLCVGLYMLYQYNKLLAKVGVFILMAFTGLVPIYPPSPVDFEFILAPALRLFHGYKISEIYFQYDLFLSFLALAAMKLNIALDWFPYWGVVGYFLFFVGSFLFADKFFKNKGLSVIFIIGLMLARIYLISHDTLLTLQVTPLRLDLWIILLLVAAYKDVRHWLIGVFLGLLVLFHRNLGLIYTLSYVELLMILFVIDAFSLIADKKFNGGALVKLVIDHIRMSIKNIAIVLAAVGICFLMFHELFSASARAYSKIGINFTQVARISFFWYVPVILGSLSIFLFYFRKKLGDKYTDTATFVLVLTIGNLMYFFGRSHENNILNLSGALILIMFVLFDVIISLAPQAAYVPPAVDKNKTDKKTPDKKLSGKNDVSKGFSISLKTIYLSLPVLFVALMGYYYSDRTSEKLGLQYNNLLESNYCLPFQMGLDTANVRQLTHNSPNVYFMDERLDFFDDYYMGYTPQGYYNPFCAYVFKKDIINIEQTVLDKGYYVVFNGRDINDYSEYLPLLRYNEVYEKNGTIALKKDDVPFLLPKDTSLVHIAMKDTLANPGIDFGGLDVKGPFTVEVIVKPYPMQKPSASIINNLSQFPYEGLKGVTIQASGVPDQYLFAYSNGLPATPNVSFHLDNNVWHYITAVANNATLKVYDNGKLVGSQNTGGNIMVNSELPFVIGNRSDRAAHFNGFIKEVKITNGNMKEADVISTGQKLDAQLNGQAVAK